jgi:hypothetical protein
MENNTSVRTIQQLEQNLGPANSPETAYFHITHILLGPVVNCLLKTAPYVQPVVQQTEGCCLSGSE